MTTSAKTPAGKGWYPDPFAKGEVLRFFDGAKFTDKTRPTPANYEPPSEDGEQKTPPRKEEQRLEPPREKAEPAKNGTMPIFAKDATPSPKKTAPKKKQPKKEAPAKETSPSMAGGWATPDPIPEEDGQQDSPAAKVAEKPAAAGWATPDPMPEPEDAGPTWSKPAQGAPQKDEASAGQSSAWSKPVAPAAEADAAPDFAKPAKKPEPQFDSATPDTAFGTEEDDELGDSAEDINSAFESVETSSGEPGFDDTAFEGASGGRLSKLHGFVSPALITWVIVVLVAAAVVVVPMYVASPVQGVPAECRPIVDIVTQYKDTDDYSLTDETKTDLASLIAQGELDEQMKSMVTKAAEENNMQPVVEHCALKR